MIVVSTRFSDSYWLISLCHYIPDTMLIKTSSIWWLMRFLSQESKRMITFKVHLKQSNWYTRFQLMILHNKRKFKDLQLSLTNLSKVGTSLPKLPHQWVIHIMRWLLIHLVMDMALFKICKKIEHVWNLIKGLKQCFVHSEMNSKTYLTEISYTPRGTTIGSRAETRISGLRKSRNFSPTMTLAFLQKRRWQLPFLWFFLLLALALAAMSRSNSMVKLRFLGCSAKKAWKFIKMPSLSIIMRLWEINSFRLLLFRQFGDRSPQEWASRTFLKEKPMKRSAQLIPRSPGSCLRHINSRCAPNGKEPSLLKTD